MYLKYYGLTEKPFQITSDPKFLWLGEKHNEALSALRYGIMENKGFVLLTGEVGTGKTVLINRLITMIDVDTIVATIPDPDLDSLDFYKILADGFKMKKTFMSKGGFLLHMRDFLHKSYSDRKQVLLIIDESQRLSHKLLEEIRLLSNIELHDRKLINIFFVGQPEFKETLMEPRNRAVAQRISVKFDILPLTEEETGDFIRHRLRVAGTQRKIFAKDAIKEIYAFADGIPRLINIICDHALLTAYAKGQKTVNREIVKECAQELHMPIKEEVRREKLLDNYDEIKKQVIEEIETKGGKETGVGAAKVMPPPRARQTKAQSRRQSSKDNNQENEKRNIFGTFMAICLAIMVLGSVGYFVSRITGDDEPRWDVEDLTPKKYKSTLDKEKENLQAKLENGDLEVTIDTPGAKKGDRLGGQSQSGGDLAAGQKSLEVEDLNSEADRSQLGVGGGGEEISNPQEDILLQNQKFIIHFEHNSNEIDKDEFETLDRIASFMVRNPDKQAMLKGYTDSSGAHSYNISISKFRANAVKLYLVGKGAPNESVKTFALGSENPIADNRTLAGRRLNRRVEIEFVSPAEVQ
jgi:general secretion pathway protein A